MSSPSASARLSTRRLTASEEWGRRLMGTRSVGYDSVDLAWGTHGTESLHQQLRKLESQ